MGYVSGGYFVSDWALVVIILAALALIASVVGAFHGTESRWSTTALGLFAAYTAWTFASLLYSPNRGYAWLGAEQTLLYLLAFGIAVALIAVGISRRWVLAASVLRPAVVATLTLSALVGGLDRYFENDRLIGTVGYYTGEAAFLLVFLSRILLGCDLPCRFLEHEFYLRGLILARASPCVEFAILTQSRGVLVALGVSFSVFFAPSGQRLRGFLALLPVSADVLVAFPDLNGIYLAFSNEGDSATALDRVIPVVWLTSGAASLYDAPLIDLHNKCQTRHWRC
jgi:hypothetical protein